MRQTSLLSNKYFFLSQLRSKVLIVFARSYSIFIIIVLVVRFWNLFTFILRQLNNWVYLIYILEWKICYVSGNSLPAALTSHRNARIRTCGEAYSHTERGQIKSDKRLLFVVDNAITYNGVSGAYVFWYRLLSAPFDVVYEFGIVSGISYVVAYINSFFITVYIVATLI